MATSLDVIRTFLSHRRIAMVGVSHDTKNFSVLLFEEFCRRGYDMVPVNPTLSEVQGRPCFPRLQAIEPTVEAALLMTSPDVTEIVVRDCVDAGVRLVWMYRAGGEGAVSTKALQSCKLNGIQVVPGECPFMFFFNGGAIHRLHGFIRKITGRYPVASLQNHADWAPHL